MNNSDEASSWVAGKVSERRGHYSWVLRGEMDSLWGTYSSHRVVLSSDCGVVHWDNGDPFPYLGVKKRWL